MTHIKAISRHFYSDTIDAFKASDPDNILGILARNSGFSDETTQKRAWQQQVELLQETLNQYTGTIFFEYSIPRMGGRVDVVLIIKNVIFVLEFKVGAKEFLLSDLDQAFDYALDLKNFHETSHAHLVAPVLIATEANQELYSVATTPHNDNVLFPIRTNANQLKEVLKSVIEFADGEYIDAGSWSKGRYSPTPTIIEAAMSLYNHHSVAEISRSDATAKNLSETSEAISEVIKQSKANSDKSICFVTGVPGAGKTLVGLKVATDHLDKNEGVTSVFLSGNGPLVAILREALTRDKVRREKELGNRVKKAQVESKVKVFIQNVHHYRDEYLKDKTAPFDHVAIFDEAQRAWNHQQTVDFMRRKKNVPDFTYSEPEFLISCLDRHKDWAVIVCLVGGGQEINKGEAGISEWIESLRRSFPDWKVFISDRLVDSEYAAGEALKMLKEHQHVKYKSELHLGVSLRSFRAERLSALVKNVLDLNVEEARKNYTAIKHKYPIVLTRDLNTAKAWLKKQARGTERYGIVVSAQAERLKPHAIDVRSPMNPIHWFLNGKDDVRSSYYLEAVATEFHVQGLELDWTCVTWDGDFRFVEDHWEHWSFRGAKWQQIRKEERKHYLKNAYRVLLTRARQGMVIVVPDGNEKDHTRPPQYYDGTFNYLKECGFDEL